MCVNVLRKLLIDPGSAHPIDDGMDSSPLRLEEGFYNSCYQQASPGPGPHVHTRRVFQLSVMSERRTDMSEAFVSPRPMSSCWSRSLKCC